MTTPPDPVRTQVEGQTLIVTLDRPKANAIDVTTSRALYAAFDRLRQDPGLRVGILTGAGDRFFSAGWDLKAAAAGEGVDADHGPGGFAGITEFLDIGKPVIAAVNGLAFGGGFELVLAADMVVAADHAEFALTEVTLGIVPDAGGMLRLPGPDAAADRGRVLAHREADDGRGRGPLGAGQPGRPGRGGHARRPRARRPGLRVRAAGRRGRA